MMSTLVNESKFYEDVTGFNNFVKFIITNKLNDIFLFRINDYAYQKSISFGSPHKESIQKLMDAFIKILN